MPWSGKPDAHKDLEVKLRLYIPQYNRKKMFRSYSIRCDSTRVSISIQVRRPMTGDDISNVVTFFQDQLGQDSPINLDETYKERSVPFNSLRPGSSFSARISSGVNTDARMGGRYDYAVDYASVTGMLTFQLTGKRKSRKCDVYLQVTSTQTTIPTGEAEHDLAPLLKALSAYVDRKQ